MILEYSNAALYSVQHTHKELLQSCYWKLKVNPTYGAELAHWTIIFGPATQHFWGHLFYSMNNSRA